MKSIFAIIAGLLLTVEAQVMLPHRHATASQSISAFTNPSSIDYIRYWWVASDHATGVVSSWTERIQSAVAEMSVSANQPTNTTNGMLFDGVQTYLTNSPIFELSVTNIPGGVNPSGSVFLVFNPDTPTTAWGAIVQRDPTAGGVQGLVAKSGNDLHYYGAVGDASVLSYTIGQTMDLLITYTNTSPGHITTFYANGVSVLTNGTGPYNQGAFGADPADSGFYKGLIMEAIFWSNQLYATEATELHKYATNKYGYSP